MLKIDQAALSRSITKAVESATEELEVITAPVRVKAVFPARSDGETNEGVLTFLEKANPGLLAMDEDIRTASITAATDAWSVGGETLKDVAPAAAEGFTRAIAVRLRSGKYVTNTPGTRAAKAREGQSTPGVATGQLASALERAKFTVE